MQFKSKLKLKKHLNYCNTNIDVQRLYQLKCYDEDERICPNNVWNNEIAFSFLRNFQFPTNVNDNATKEFWYMNDEAQIENNI